MSISKPLYSASKYRLSRRGKKLQMSDDQRILLALPKDVPERTWAEILQKEENDLLIYDIREEIIEEAMNICYEKYMERQNVVFTAYCAQEAWLKLIQWYFFRHDPGEDPSAYPPCYIPKRNESWIPDEMPDPSPKDALCQHDLTVVEENPEVKLKKWPSSSSIDLPVIEEIPQEYWFPGKVYWPHDETESEDKLSKTLSYATSETPTPDSKTNLGTESEILQKVTDYNAEPLSAKESPLSTLKTTTPVEGSLHGAGDSMVDKMKTKKKSKLFSKPSMLGRSKATLPPLDGSSRSRFSIISDCRLRNLRLETNFDITSEKLDTPPGEVTKRK